MKYQVQVEHFLESWQRKKAGPTSEWVNIDEPWDTRDAARLFMKTVDTLNCMRRIVEVSDRSINSNSDNQGAQRAE